jgi:uncharacterized RDD family membrane protein YckC
MLDITRVIETPEGVDLSLQMAGPVPRALAWAIDFLLRLVVYLALLVVFVQMGKLGVGLLALVAFVMEWWYPVLFETLYRGQTPGKRFLGLRVLHDNGTPVAGTASVVRNLLRAVDFLPLFYGLGLLSMLIDRDFRRLGDLAAGTIVVHVEVEKKHQPLPDAEAILPPVTFHREEWRALLDYAERSTQLSSERSAELADLLSPVTGAETGKGARTLYGYAAWIAGRERA